MSQENSLPRENIVRAVFPAVELRDTAEDGDVHSTLFGHFARFDEWTEINSTWEGRFMERFVPRSFTKTLNEQRDKLRVLFQHGQDPDIGDKPIAQIQEVREDEEGAYYEARLFDGLPPLVLEGLRAGQYGASFRFSVMREEIDERPGETEHNPNGLPERTVKEARVAEFGPVTFPAYAGATAGVRSMTDEIIQSYIRSNPDGIRRMLDQSTDLGDLSQDTSQETEQDAPSEEAAEPVEVHRSDERREDKPAPRSDLYGTRRKETSQPWRLEPLKSTKRT